MSDSETIERAEEPHEASGNPREHPTGCATVPPSAQSTELPAWAQRLESQLRLIRTELGLSPIHDVVEAVRVLHSEGHAAFVRMRGPRCPHAHEWEARKLLHD